MTLDEALAELHIEAGVSAEEARRAYLRLIKIRKPESDPEGFRRLREAFELVRERLASREGPRMAMIPALLPTPRLEPTPIGLDEISGQDLPLKAPTTVLAVDSVAEFGQLLAHGDLAGAAVILARLYATAPDGLHTTLPPPRVAIDLLLRLHERDELAKARQLEQSLHHWLSATGNEVLALGSSAPGWLVVRKVGVLMGTVSPEVRTAMASASMTGNSELAYEAMTRWRMRDPPTAARDAVALRALGSPLSLELAQVLAPSARRPFARPSDRRRPSVGRALIALMVTMSALRSLMTTHDCDTTGTRPVATQQRNPGIYGDLADGQRAIQSAERLATVAADMGEDSVTMTARALQTALATGGCDAARAHVRELSSRETYPALRERINETLGAVSRACAWPLNSSAADSSTIAP